MLALFYSLLNNTIMNRLSIILLSVLAMACHSKKETITNPADYAVFLEINSENEKLKLAEKELTFWSGKFEKSPNQTPYLIKMAAANNALFEQKGDINYLVSAENQLIRANEMAGSKSASQLRALAKTHITQHKFREALSSLQKADSLGEGKLATQMMLFDVNMELGNYDKAEAFLTGQRETETFNYLIRLAKWHDFEGDTQGAIDQLQRALQKAEEMKSEPLKLWTYSNLGDYYGHVGNIEKSYEYYLKTLAIDPHYDYALKGIAWIVFSYERNPEEAERIIKVLQKRHEAPDYQLLLAEIAEFRGNEEAKARHINNFLATVSSPSYGDMYNAYLVTLLENEPEKALELAKKEVINRPTPQSYQLLSYASMLNGRGEEALKLADQYVNGKTFEPVSLYQLATVYKKSGRGKEVEELKKELMGAYFEVGPLMEKEIEKL